MDRSAVLTLVSTTHIQDIYGVWRTVTQTRDIFCDVMSVSRDEFFEGGRNGLNPEYRFDVFGPDYEGETVCEYQGLRYAIYRTYQTRTDTLELYVQREGGTN